MDKIAASPHNEVKGPSSSPTIALLRAACSRCTRLPPDNPCDGHTLRDVLGCTETLTCCAIEWAYVDKSHRDREAPNSRRAFISDQSAASLAPATGSCAAAAPSSAGRTLHGERHLGRCRLKGHPGNVANVVLSAVGHNSGFGLVSVRGPKREPSPPARMKAWLGMQSMMSGWMTGSLRRQ